jgi:hypothetical protein
MSMYWSFQLGLLGRHLRDSAAIFRYRSQHAEDLYGEASYFWNDQRGVAFARGYLSPQLNLVPSVSASLATIASHMNEARQAAEIAEAHIMSVRSATEGIEMITEESLHAATKANHFAEDTINRAQSVAATASAIHGRVQILGDPPI